MKPPTFFLSSTIYDFQDLRSAIKYFLEQQGYRVLASECNDFARAPDPHSYEACLQAIRQADWFLLFIGSRVGGWYDPAEKISITQMEYRQAYRLHVEGKIKLLNFVRADVWRMKEDRKELAKHLEILGLDPGAKSQILSYPSKAAGDADFISSFIDEVRRNKDTVEALKEKGPLPTGNWIHVFSDFQDIIEPIQVQMFAGLPLDEAVFRRLLRRELREFLRISLVRPRNGRAFSPRISCENVYATLPNKLTWKRERTIVNTKYFHCLCSVWIHFMTMRFNPLVLTKASSSGAFMKFDPTSGAMVEQPVMRGLLELTREIGTAAMMDNGMVNKFVSENSPKARPNVRETMDVDTSGLAALLSTTDRWTNIIELCRAIIRYLDGKPFIMPNLRPRSPMHTDEEMKEQEATEVDVDAFLKDNE